MYACQLLIPTVREHHECFGRRRDPRCELKFDPLASPFCRLVTSVTQDVHCIQQYSKDCSEAALEMLQPIIDESEGDQRIVEMSRSSRRSSTNNGTQNQYERCGQLFVYIYDICSSDYSKSPYASIAAKICLRQDEIAKQSDCYQSTLEKEKCALRDAKTECEALEAFKANHAHWCYRLNNDHCEVDAQNTEQGKGSSVKHESTCDGEDNVCVPPDGALLVIEIQEAINDIIIERKCFETKEKAAAPVVRTDDPDEFHLDTKLPHCTDDQVCMYVR
ncbi:hypothetical protein OSTOST_18093 [Ostertagia ostertagi]